MFYSHSLYLHNTLTDFAAIWTGLQFLFFLVSVLVILFLCFLVFRISVTFLIMFYIKTFSVQYLLSFSFKLFPQKFQLILSRKQSFNGRKVKYPLLLMMFVNYVFTIEDRHLMKTCVLVNIHWKFVHFPQRYEGRCQWVFFWTLCSNLKSASRSVQQFHNDRTLCLYDLSVLHKCFTCMLLNQFISRLLLLISQIFIG